MRVGLGYDIHRIIPTAEPSKVHIGGVALDCFYRVEAHSDGDVLLHALTDAVFGALALGDIGQWFPDNKDENKDQNSCVFIKAAVDEVHRLGWEVNQCDSTLIIESPKIAPHSDAIRQSLAKLLGVELSSVSVKATTNEGLGAVGQRKAIAAHAVVTLKEIRK